jgi:peroxiredoxin
VKTFFYMTFLLVCISVFLTSCGRDGDTVIPGESAKDFRLDTLSHERFYLNQHKGKVVVLVFWTTWCSICKGELVELNSIKNVSENGDVVVASICSDPEDINAVKQIVESLKIEYPVLLDKGQTVTGRYMISAFPTTIIIDQKGVVSFTREGYNPAIASQLKTKISSLLVSDESAE